jgi:hypothetical protein
MQVRQGERQIIGNSSKKFFSVGKICRRQANGEACEILKF